jgi:hypothetical protein
MSFSSRLNPFFFFFIVCEKWNFFLCVCNPLYALLDQLFSWMIVLVASGFDEWIQLCCGVLGWVLASLDGKVIWFHLK